MTTSPTRRAVRAILALSAVVGLLASPETALAATFRVRGVSDGGFVWRPKTRSIAVGDTVRWKAVAGNHNVRSRGPNWSFFRNLPEGSAVSRTFNRRGTFRYYCTIHGRVAGGACQGMCGRIVVG